MSFDNPYNPPSPTSIPSSGRDRLLRVAKAQRQVNIAVLLYFGIIPVNIALNLVGAGSPLGSALFLIIVVYALIVFGLGAVSVYKLASIYRGNLVAIIYALGLLAPVLGLLLLLSISSKATKELRAAGIKVGLLGANLNEI